MHAKVKAVAIALLCPTCSIAAEIYGTISEGGKPIRNESVRIECRGSTPESKPEGKSESKPEMRRSDEYGSYRVFTNALGRCELFVGDLRVEVYSYERAVRYDFEIITKDRKPFLQRR